MSQVSSALEMNKGLSVRYCYPMSMARSILESLRFFDAPDRFNDEIAQLSH